MLIVISHSLQITIIYNKYNNVINNVINVIKLLHSHRKSTE